VKTYHNDEGAAYRLETLIPFEQIMVESRKAAARIDERFEKIHIIGLLKGSFVFMSDLIREITIPLTLDFMAVSSYIGTESSGEVKILKELNEPIAGRDILILEDIIDTGLTLEKTVELLRTREPHSITIVSLLDKPSRRKMDINADIACFEIPDEFVVGYGIDYQQRHRELRDVCKVVFL
jgi:hypoxanthine phosphoribosyltransferase